MCFKECLIIFMKSLLLHPQNFFIIFLCRLYVVKTVHVIPEDSKLRLLTLVAGLREKWSKIRSGPKAEQMKSVCSIQKK